MFIINGVICHAFRIAMDVWMSQFQLYHYNPQDKGFKLADIIGWKKVLVSSPFMLKITLDLTKQMSTIGVV